MGKKTKNLLFIFKWVAWGMGVTQSMAQISKVGGQEWGVCWLGKGVGACLQSKWLRGRSPLGVWKCGNWLTWRAVRGQWVKQMVGGVHRPPVSFSWDRSSWSMDWRGLAFFKCAFGYKAVTVNNWTGDMPLCASLNTGYTWLWQTPSDTVPCMISLSVAFLKRKFLSQVDDEK